VAALGRIPVSQSQTIMLLDAAGNHAVLYIGPDRAPGLTSALVCTNHQESVTWPEMAARNRTVERHTALSDALSTSSDIDALAAALMTPPLYRQGRGAVTAYTAVYRPAEGTVDYLWPGKRWRQRFDTFVPGRYKHDYGG
jgi:predicted choloylglycine hydrolase